MIITIEQYKDIITAGAGITIDATTLTFKQISELATAAKAAKVSLSLTKVSAISAAHLKQLAALAPGYITIDLT